MKCPAHRFATTVLALAAATILAAVPAAPAVQAGPFRAMLQQHAGNGAGDGRARFGEHEDATPRRLPAGVHVDRDVAYGNAPRQKLDIYAPAGAHDVPVIVMVHGGAWMFGDKAAKNVVEGKVNRWVPRGFVFVSIDYRLVPQVRVADEAQDVAAALAYVQGHIATWGGDGRRVVLMGHSAGAHLVALISASPILARAHGVQPWLGTITLDSAAYDVVTIMQRPHPRFYDRAFESDPVAWRADSPTLQLDRHIVPVLAVCSIQRDDSCPAARQFVARADSLGGHAQLLQEDKTHEQINKDLGADAAYTAQVEAFMGQLDPSIARLLGH